MADPQNEQQQQNKRKYLYKAPWAMEENPLTTLMTENCLVKTTMAVTMGGVFGFFMGFLFNTMGPEPHINRDRSAKEQVVRHFKDVGRNGMRSAKGFSAAAGLYSATECTLEKIRGERDMVGTLTAGCVSGAVLAVRGGPQAMAMGCGGFAAFSAVFDHFLEKDARSELIQAMPTEDEAREALERQQENAWEGSWVAKQLRDSTPPALIPIPLDEDDDEWEYYEEEDEE